MHGNSHSCSCFTSDSASVQNTEKGQDTPRNTSVAQREIKQYLEENHVDLDGAIPLLQEEAIQDFKRNFHLAKAPYKPPRCDWPGCPSGKQSSSRFCNRHGAHSPTCQRDGCGKIARNGGLCYGHGAKYSKSELCPHPGCKKTAKGVCATHAHLYPERVKGRMLCTKCKKKVAQKGTLCDDCQVRDETDDSDLPPLPAPAPLDVNSIFTISL